MVEFHSALPNVVSFPSYSIRKRFPLTFSCVGVTFRTRCKNLDEQFTHFQSTEFYVYCS